MKFYLCNGDAPGRTKTNCYLNGGECKHTKNPNSAKNIASYKFATHEDMNFIRSGDKWEVEE